MNYKYFVQMNIIIANTQEFNPQIGGVERVSTVLASEFAKLGHNIYFVAYIISPFSKTYMPAVEQLLLPNSKTAFCEENIAAFTLFALNRKVNIILNQAGNILDFTQLCVAVKNKIDIRLITEIHINPDYQIKAYLDCTFSKLKSQSTLREQLKRLLKSIYPYKLKSIQDKEKELYQYVYNYSDKVVLLSKNFIPIFLELADIAKSSKLIAISNPLPFLVKNINLKAKKKQILFVGRLDFGQKRPDRALILWESLYKKFPDWNLIILGDGTAKEELLELSHKLKLERISFAGFQDPKSFYKDSSIILMTSAFEGFGMVLIEAAQYGAIPVAYDTFESLKDIIDDGVNGYRVSAPYKKNANKLLSNLMLNTELRISMSNIAYIQTSKFSLDIIVNDWITLFHSLN